MFVFVPSTWHKVPKDLVIPWVPCNECFSTSPEFILMRWLLLGFPLNLPPRRGTGGWRKQPCDGKVSVSMPAPWPLQEEEKGWSLISIISGQQLHQSGLGNATPERNPKELRSESLRVGAGRMVPRRRHGSSAHAPRDLPLRTPSIWLFLSCILSSKRLVAAQ